MNKKKLAYRGGSPVCNSIEPFNTIDSKELNAVKKVMEKGKLSGFFANRNNGFLGGEKVREFEKNICDFFDVKYAIAVNSWTSGLQICVGAIDIQPGDEVIVSPWTMCATVSSIVNWLGIPVFADIDPNTLTICPEAIERKITKKTKAIMTVDIHGLSSDMKTIKKIAKKYKLKIICDTAQAPAAKYNNKFAGTLGDIGGFSLNYHKHIHTGEGGVIVTNSSKLAQRSRLIRNHAEVIVQQTDYLSNMIGGNYRMGEIEAAIGIEQLKKLNKIFNSRKKIADSVKKVLNNFDFINIPPTPKNQTHSYYMIPILYDSEKTGVSRKKLVSALQAEGLNDIIYEGFSLVHMLPMFQKKIGFGKSGYPWKKPIANRDNYDYSIGICPVAEDYYSNKFIGFCNCMIRGNNDDIKKIEQIFLKVLSQIEELK